MNYQILANGDLEISLEPFDDKEEIAAFDIHWENIFDSLGLIGNGWGCFDPIEVGALTEAPMVTDDFSVLDNGDKVILGNVWWFPNYCVENPVETLVEKGRVVFTFAPNGP